MPISTAIYSPSPNHDPAAVNGSLSHGWVHGCDRRGTSALLWSCISTLFICLWVMVHLNIPASHEGYWTNFLRKLRWLVIAALLPEMLLLASGGQWASAKRSKAVMRALGHEHWSLSHGFYADMGGFLLQPPDYPPFPITAQQLHYLITEKYVAVPNIPEKEITDKRKADLFAKVFLCVQAGWFVAQSIGRGTQRLAISPLELYTCGVILCVVTTVSFWMKKPLDVTTPMMVPMTTTIATICLRVRSLALVSLPVRATQGPSTPTPQRSQSTVGQPHTTRLRGHGHGGFLDNPLCRLELHFSHTGGADHVADGLRPCRGHPALPRPARSEILSAQPKPYVLLGGLQDQVAAELVFYRINLAVSGCTSLDYHSGDLKYACITGEFVYGCALVDGCASCSVVYTSDG